MYSKKVEAGFTLVELLIVIVIIGILAGLLIGIINPFRQQMRARDGVISSSFNKILMEVRSLAVADVTGVLDLPGCTSLTTNLGNISTSDTICTGNSTTGTATFSINGITGSTGALSVFKYSYDNTANPKTFCLSVPLATDATRILRITNADGETQLSATECF
jgi:prepilin-type N-terminal cleavage/methylation domain-containing protein